MQHSTCHFKLKRSGESYPVQFSVGEKNAFFEITQDLRLQDNFLSYYSTIMQGPLGTTLACTNSSKVKPDLCVDQDQQY